MINIATNTRCPQKGISLLPDHHVLSARRTNSKPRLTPFSLNFCFGLDSPSEIRTRLFGVLCLGLVLGLVGFGFVVLCLVLVPGSYLLSVPIQFNQGDLCLSAHTAPPPVQKSLSQCALGGPSSSDEG